MPEQDLPMIKEPSHLSKRLGGNTAGPCSPGGSKLAMTSCSRVNHHSIQALSYGRDVCQLQQEPRVCRKT